MRGFLFGAMVGALAAVMMAPRRGEETRELVRARVDLWQDQMMNKLEQARGDVEMLRRDVMLRLEEIKAQFGLAEEEMKIRTEGAASRRPAPPEPPGPGA